MKKTIKILTAVALIGILCMLFTGCDMLQEMKAVHGIISKDNQSVTYQGKTFKRLPDGVPYFFNDVNSNRCNITTEDVPVLLSEDFGYRGYYDALKGILVVNAYDYTMSADTYLSSVSYPEAESYMYFCEEELYEEYSKLTIEQADRIAIVHYNADFETLVFSESVSKEIFGIITESTWDTDIYEEVIDNSRDVIYPLYRCDKELTLRGTLSGYELYIMQSREIYMTNYYVGGAVRLSDTATEYILERYYDYSPW